MAEKLRGVVRGGAIELDKPLDLPDGTEVEVTISILKACKRNQVKMANMALDDYFKNGRVHIWKETFAVVKAKRRLPDAFAVICDRSETTVVIEQSKVKDEYVIEVEKDWKMLTFEMVLPFGLVGFLARVSKAMAEEKISIFAISAYSTDHILVKEKDLAKAIAGLERLGCFVKTEQAVQVN